MSWLEASTIDQRRANCFLPRLQTIYIGISWQTNDIRGPLQLPPIKKIALEDEGESGATQALGHNHTCALLEVFTWEGSLGLDKHQTDALKGLIDGGLRINLVAKPENDQVLKI